MVQGSILNHSLWYFLMLDPAPCLLQSLLLCYRFCNTCSHAFLIWHRLVQNWHGYHLLHHNIRTIELIPRSQDSWGSHCQQSCWWPGHHMLRHLAFLHQIRQGDIHTLQLSNSLYVPGLPQTLLCLQHWAQVDQDQGTSAINTWRLCTLVWNKGRSSKCIPLSTKTNTHIFMTAPETFVYRFLRPPSWPLMHYPHTSTTLPYMIHCFEGECSTIIQRSSSPIRTSPLRTKNCGKKKTNQHHQPHWCGQQWSLPCPSNSQPQVGGMQA